MGGVWFLSFELLVVSVTLLARVDITRASWIDPDTPMEFRKSQALSEGDERQYQLVFSDEFEQEGRTFNDGFDPRWTAINKNDYTNAALHYYSEENVRTTNGVLNITTEQKTNAYKAFNEKTKKFYADKKYIQSGMVQGWNKFCITGGIVEISAKLPGDPFVGGLWPALWMLGNLARATYVGSSDFMWPYSYNQCDEKTRMSQEISACSKVNHFGMDPGRGRGAPEIDLLEAMQGDSMKLPNTPIRRPYGSMSLQIAPGLENDRPILGHQPKKGHWYTHLDYGNSTNSSLNPFFYGVTLVHEPKSYTYQADALSANLHLKETHYKSFHKYRIEWEPPLEDGSEGYIKWYADDEFVYGIHADSLSLTGAEIPSEPMYLIINTAVSSHWGFPAPCPTGCDCKCFECGKPDCACGLPSGYCDNFPGAFEVDYVRVYQAVNESKHYLGCSPEKRPTDLFIKGHRQRYMEEGDKRPLNPIQDGGGACINDSDCGGLTNGACTERGECMCHETFTGPTCLAHNGFYDHENRVKLPNFTLSSMVIPRSLIVIVVVLAIGFASAFGGLISRHRRDARYEKLDSSNSHDNAGSGQGVYSGANSYQNTASADYTLPQQKVVTYCVIDGRLIDA